MTHHPTRSSCRITQHIVMRMSADNHCCQITQNSAFNPQTLGMPAKTSHPFNSTFDDAMLLQRTDCDMLHTSILVWLASSGYLQSYHILYELQFFVFAGAVRGHTWHDCCMLDQEQQYLCTNQYL